jgi:arylsulfatase A-like enzyme
MRMYLGMCSLVDQKVGEIMALLEKRGMLDNTWIIFLSDHGEMMGNHHMMGKTMFYKSSVQIPALIRPPKKPAMGEISQPVEMIDMTTTILDIAGAKPLPDSKGISLVPAMQGKNLSKPAVYSVIAASRSTELMAAVRTADYRYTVEWKSQTPCEFYDMKNDPDELKNLVDDAAMKAKRDEHHELIAAHMGLPPM